MILLAQGQRNTGVRMVQTGLATSSLRNGLREPCLCPLVYCCICLLTLFVFLVRWKPWARSQSGSKPQQNKSLRQLWDSLRDRLTASVLTQLIIFFFPEGFCKAWNINPFLLLLLCLYCKWNLKCVSTKIKETKHSFMQRIYTYSEGAFYRI